MPGKVEFYNQLWQALISLSLHLGGLNSYLALKVKHLFICPVYCFCGIIAPRNLGHKIKCLKIIEFSWSVHWPTVQLVGWSVGCLVTRSVTRLLGRSVSQSEPINQLYFTRVTTHCSGPHIVITFHINPCYLNMQQFPLDHKDQKVSYQELPKPQYINKV